jgi:hypothetical protein
MVVLAIGLVLTVMVGGIVALTVREQQKQSNTEFSNRALQTAEAGVQVASQLLSKNLSYTKIGCAPGNDFANVVSDPNQQITCVEVKSVFTDFEGFSYKDRSTTFFINSETCDANNPQVVCADKSADSLLVRWNSKDDAGSPYICSTDCAYPKFAGYTAAASIELSFIYWPRSNAADMKTATAFVVPGNDDKGLTAGPQAIQARCEGQPNVSADTLGSYKCATANSKQGFDLKKALNIQGNINDFSIAVRITPRYANTHYQLQAFSNGQNVVPVKSSKAQIDVTAKVSNLYRRVKAEKIIIPSAVEGVFDSVLYSGKGINENASKDICKQYKVLNTGSVVPGSDKCI